MKEEFIKRQNKRSEKIESLIDEFGSIDNIPDKFKDDIIKEAMKDLPKINAIHISIMQRQLEKRTHEIAILEFIVFLLSLAFILHIVIK